MSEESKTHGYLPLLGLVVCSVLLLIGQMRYGRLLAKEHAAKVQAGETIFSKTCASCHAQDNPLVPDFGLSATLAVAADLRNGEHHNTPALSEKDFDNLITWLSSHEAKQEDSSVQGDNPE